MDAARASAVDESGERHGASFECQNWPREKGALPRARGWWMVKRREWRKEILPPLLKKKVDLGQLWWSGKGGKLQH